MSLEDAILGLNREKGTLAQQLLQQQRDRRQQQRQFNQQMAFNRESLAAQERSSARAAAASAAAMPSLGDLFGGGGQQGAGAGGGGGKNKDTEQQQFNYVKRLIDMPIEERVPIVQSMIDGARSGNPWSKSRLRFYYQLRNIPIPQSFRSFLK
jgi:hypothetical protein